MTVNTICLCGSTRFLDDFNRANVELTKRGLSVITISMALVGEEQQKQAPLKELLDLVHFNKILRADAVLVVGDGYIGYSTAREVLWSLMQGKAVHMQVDYMDKNPVIGHVTDWDMLSMNIKLGECIDSGQGMAAENVLHEKASGA